MESCCGGYVQFFLSRCCFGRRTAYQHLTDDKFNFFFIMEQKALALVKDCLQNQQDNEYLCEIAKDVNGANIQPIDTGYTNHVFRVTAADGSQSCVVKVYGGHVKSFGPEYPMDPQRSQREKEAIELFVATLELQCPNVYLWDGVNNLVYLQDLSCFCDWGRLLTTSCDLQIGAKVADIMVHVHSSTHRLKQGPEAFALLQERFSPYAKQVNFLCDVQFVRPFQADHRKNIKLDPAIRAKIDEITTDEVVTRAATLAQEWMAVGKGDCCIHGDLHVGSLMADFSSGNVKIVDLESTRIGPEAYDVGLLVSNYVLLYHYHQQLSHFQSPNTQHAGDQEHVQLRKHILDLICITLSRYMNGMRRALGPDFDNHQVWKQVLLFLGLELIAWISGPSTFALLDLQPEAQMNCLNTGLRILHKESLCLDTRDISRLIHNH